MRAFLLAVLIGLQVLGAAPRAAAETGDAGCEALLRKLNQRFESADGEGSEWYHLLTQLHQAYDQRLAPFPDPFIHDLTLEDAQRKFEGLSYLADQASPSVRKLSILGETRDFINKNPVRNLESVRPILQKIVAYSQKQIVDPQATRADLYRGRVALDLLLPALAPILPPEATQSDDDPAAKDQPEAKTKQKSKPQQPGQEQPKKYPDKQDNYKPNTKDTEAGKVPAEGPPVVIAEINVPKIPYFILGVYNTITRGAAHPFQASPLPNWNRRLPDHVSTSVKLKLNLLGKSEGTLLLPAGFEPVAADPSREAKISLKANGDYHIQGAGGQVEINMIPESLQLGPAQMEFLRRKVGFSENEWPSDVRIHLLDHVRDLDPMQAAQKVETYLRNEYKYSVGARPETDPIDALKAGAFQCDMAAYIMVAILRDHLHVPCRPAYGFRGQTKNGLNGSSVVQLPSEMHAFVQCFDNNGNAQVFDPTPKNKDKADAEEIGALGDASDNSKEFADDKPEDPSAQENPAGKASADSQDQDKNNKSVLKENTEKSLSEQKEARGEKNHTSAEDEKLNHALTQGSQSLRPSAQGATLERRARHLFMRQTMDPTLETSAALQRLSKFKSDQGSDPAIQPVIDAAENALLLRQRPVVESLYSVAGSVKKAEVTATFKSLVQIEDRLRLYTQLQDDGQRDGLNLRLENLRKIKAEFQNLNDKDRLETAVADKFFSSLPPHARALVSQRFKIQSIGNNVETKAMMQDLAAGKLRDMNLIRTLYPMTDFISDSTPAPAFRTVKVYEEDRRYMNGREFLPVSDLADARRALRLQPNKSYARNMLEGTLFLPVKRRQISLPDPGGKAQPHRVTVALYDTSGSMSGPPGDFQAGLLAAFVDRALSDHTAGGIYRHKCLLMGFDDKVHSTRRVINSYDAYDVIRNYRQQLKNTNGGTDIMKALVEAVNQIVEAEKTAGEPLAAANIVLMSDGQSNVSLETMKKQLARVNRKTPIKFMFIAINGENTDLISLANMAVEAGAAESYYQRFTGEQIQDLIAQGNKPPRVNLERELYAAKGAADLPSNIDTRISNLAQDINLEIQRLHAAQKPRDLQAWHQDMQMTPVLTDTEKPTQIKAEINRLRSLLYRSNVLKEHNFPSVLVDDVMKNFAKTFGKPFDPLMVREREEINHLLDESMRYIAGGGKR